MHSLQIQHAVKSHQEVLASLYTSILFTPKTAAIYLICSMQCYMVYSREIQYLAVHLSEMDVLCGCEVEALLVALMLQQTLREPICYFHIAAVVLLCVQGGVGQHGCCLLDIS